MHPCICIHIYRAISSDAVSCSATIERWILSSWVRGGSCALDVEVMHMSATRVLAHHALSRTCKPFAQQLLFERYTSNVSRYMYWRREYSSAYGASMKLARQRRRGAAGIFARDRSVWRVADLVWTQDIDMISLSGKRSITTVSSNAASTRIRYSKQYSKSPRTAAGASWVKRLKLQASRPSDPVTKLLQISPTKTLLFP